MATKRTTLALGETHLGDKVAQVMATPNANMSFWIITIMLVFWLVDIEAAMKNYRKGAKARRFAKKVQSGFSLRSSAPLRLCGELFGLGASCR